MIDTQKVEQVIEVIRPAIQADNGDIHLRGVDEESGVVSVELVGACVSCPASTNSWKIRRTVATWSSGPDVSVTRWF